MGCGVVPMEDNSANLTKYWKGKLDDVLKGDLIRLDQARVSRIHSLP